ncbi:MAG: 16S rRNA (adenine(1518)-N(6)/adenine(1519)-N(6))-dimethyltransferase RsmA [Eubacteriales bacterium]
MHRHGIAPQKRYGQNFLINPTVVSRIADTCADENAGVIEIGPGIGTLTRELSPRFRKVVALEIDTSLIPVLEETLADLDNVKVINADAMKIDLADLVREEFADMPVYVCANLPYYITSPIVMSLLEAGGIFEAVTVMIQKEVADRFCASAGSADYGAITLAVNYYSDVEKCFNVAPGNFMPPPKVTSSVIRMNIRKEPPVSVRDKENMFRMIRAAFTCRRKTLVNALCTSSSKCGKEEVIHILTKLGYDPNIRGERLSLSDYARISDELTV